MKRISAVSLGFLPIAALAAGPAAAEPMTLPQAVEAGLRRSPELGQSQARTDAAKAGRDAARREWLPKVTLDAAAGLRHLSNDARINVGLSAIDEKPLYASVNVDQPLLDFGRRSNETKSRDAKFVAAQKDELGVAEQASLDISRSYLQVLLQERVVAAAQQNLAFHEALGADVREGVAKGALSISEQQQAAERLQTARVQMVGARTDLDAARDTLALLLGRSDVEVSQPEASMPLVPATETEAIDRASAADPAVQAAMARYEAARHDTGRARSERFPTVALQGAYRYGKDFEGYRGLTKDAQGLVTMRWAIFDGGVAAARVREAGAMENEAWFVLDAARRDSELKARTGWTRLQAMRDRLREQEERSAIASQVLESYKAQFGIGRRSLLDLLDAQAAVYNAQVEAELARAGALLSAYMLLAQSRQLTEALGVEPARVPAGPSGR